MKKRYLIIGLGISIVVILLAVLLFSRRMQPEGPGEPAYLPTDSWLTSTPQAQDFSSTKPVEPDQAVPPSYWPADSWQTSTPEEQGFSSQKLVELLQYIKNHKLAIDSLLIIRNGRLILDAYFYPFASSIPHKLHSVTKSFTTTLVGIAIDQGKLQLDQSMLSFFPDRTIANLDDNKKNITVRYLVSNTSGFASGCLRGDVTEINQMQSTPDWIQYALDRKMARPPGEGFCYDSPGMHILSAIIQSVTGMTEFDFAREYLFNPLGIKQAYWKSDPQGYTHGWADLYLKPSDAARLGYLWLNQGVWDSKQVISSAWVEQAVKKNTFAGIDDYGYGWWVSEDNYYALGHFGQYVKVFPAINTLVVITASGLDYDEIASRLSNSFVDPDMPLPADPIGEAKLKEAVAAAARSPHPWQSGPLPDTAYQISGKTFIFEQNPLELESFQFKFGGMEQVTLYLKLEGKDLQWPIGLDGEYRVEPEGRALRGYWSDPYTFNFELYEDDLQTFTLRLVEDGVILDHLSLSIKGQENTP